MSEKSFCTQLQTNIGKYEFEINKYVLPAIQPNPLHTRTDHYSSNNEEESNENTTNFEQFKRKEIPVKPSMCLWSFLSKQEIIQIKETKEKRLTLKLIDEKVNKTFSKGSPRLFFRELMFSVTQFSDKYNFNINQTGAILSMFYNTHQHFTYNLPSSAEETYNFFKENIFFTSIFLPPWRLKIFSLNECQHIILYFCRIYLRNLPLIRLMTMPNYGFLLKAQDIPVVEEKKTKKSVSTKKKGKKL